MRIASRSTFVVFTALSLAAASCGSSNITPEMAKTPVLEPKAIATDAPAPSNVATALPAASLTAAPVVDPAPTQTPAPLKITRFALDNGLDVVVNEDHTETFVAVHIRYRVGAMEDPPGKSGRAHLIEHLMFQGTGDGGAGFLETIKTIGAQMANGTTSFDRLSLFEVVPTPMLDPILRLEAARVGTVAIRLTQQELDEQRSVVKQELKLTAPRNIASRAVAPALFPAGHPYREAVGGDPTGFGALTLGDIKAALTKLYVPANTTLVLSGDVNLAGAKALVTKYFGGFAKTPAMAPRTRAALKLKSKRMITIEASNAAESIALVWPAPAFYAAGDAELDVLAEILGGPGHRLSEQLRTVVGAASTASTASAFENSALLVSQFSINAEVPSGGAQVAIAGVEGEIARLANSPPSDDEVAQARVSLTAIINDSLKRLQARAATLATIAAGGRDPTHPEELAARYAKITPADVSRVAAEVLVAKPHVIVSIVPNPAAPTEGRVRP